MRFAGRAHSKARWHQTLSDPSGRQRRSGFRERQDRANRRRRSAWKSRGRRVRVRETALRLRRAGSLRDRFGPAPQAVFSVRYDRGHVATSRDRRRPSGDLLRSIPADDRVQRTAVWIPPSHGSGNPCDAVDVFDRRRNHRGRRPLSRVETNGEICGHGPRVWRAWRCPWLGRSASGERFAESGPRLPVRGGSSGLDDQPSDSASVSSARRATVINRVVDGRCLRFSELSLSNSGAGAWRSRCFRSSWDFS